MAERAKQLPDWPWTGLLLSVVYLFLVFSLPCLGGPNCHQPANSGQQYSENRETFAVLCAQTKCTITKEEARQSQHQSCNGAVCWVWSASNRYLMLISDDPVALFTALLFLSTSLLWWVTRNTWKHAQESSERELRAYVGITGIEFDVRSTEVGYVPMAMRVPPFIFDDFMSVRIKNFGQTPAYKVTIRAGTIEIAHLGRVPVGYDFDSHLYGPVSVENVVSADFLQGGQDTIIKTPLADARAIWNTQRKTAGCLAFGRIWYEDTFANLRSTKFCQIWEPWHPSGSRFVPYAEFNGEDQREPPT